MRGLICNEWCEFKDLKISDFHEPELIPGGVRIDVAYAGVGFAHSLVVAGKYQVRPPLPFIPGSEVSGVVTEVAEGVERVKKGDRVLANIDWGGFAQQVVAPTATVYLLPPDADLAAALNLSTSYATAYSALVWRARLQPEETLLVHGAGGALGLAAVELGKLLQARVVACAATEEKRAAALAQGADLALSSTNFREHVKQFTSGRGADIIFDPVGGHVFDESLRAIAPLGRILPVGFASGVVPQIPANIVLVKNISVLGHYFGTYIKGGAKDARDRYEPEVQSMMFKLIEWMHAGKLTPRVSEVFAFNDYAQAMAAVLERRSIGKVVLNVGASH